MRWVAILCVLFAVLLGGSTAASAETPYDEKERPDQVKAAPTYTLPPIVTAPSRAEQDAFKADRTVNTVSRDDLLKLQAMGTPEALQEVPGVMAQKTNRGAGSPYLRGLVGPRNLLVIDGIRLNNATFRTGPNQYLSLLDPSATRRLEVLMGPASVTYGSDAMGGVVASEPWQVRKKPGTSAFALLQTASADLSAGLSGTASWKGESAGIRVGGAVRQFGQLTAGGGQVVPLSEYQSGAWHLRGRYDLGKHTSLGVSWFGTRLRDAGRIDRINQGRFRLYDNDSDIGWVELRHRSPAGLLKSLRVAATFHRTWEDVQRFRCNVTDPLAERDKCIADGLPARHNDSVTPAGNVHRQEHWEDTVLTPGFMAVAQLRITEGIEATIGTEGQHDMVDATKRERRADKNDWAWDVKDRGNFSSGSTYTQGGVFGLADVRLLRNDAGELKLSGGGRLSMFAAQADNVPQFGTVQYSQLGAVGSLGLRWLSTKKWASWLHVSQGFRAPNLQESTVLGDTGSKIEVPNGDLKPESSVAMELGVRTRLKRLELAAVGFMNLLSDTIDERELAQSEWTKLGLSAADVDNKPVVQRINAGAGRFVGAELSATVNLAASMAVWLKGSFIQGEIERKDETVTARRTPPPMGNAGFRWNVTGVDGLQVEVYSRFAAGQDELHPSDVSDLRICESPENPGKTYKDLGQTCPGTAGWATANVRVRYKLGKQLRLDVAGLNLLDAQYRYHGSGIDEPGRGVALSVAGRL